MIGTPPSPHVQLLHTQAERASRCLAQAGDDAVETGISHPVCSQPHTGSEVADVPSMSVIQVHG